MEEETTHLYVAMELFGEQDLTVQSNYVLSLGKNQLVISPKSMHCLLKRSLQLLVDGIFPSFLVQMEFFLDVDQMLLIS